MANEHERGPLVGIITDPGLYPPPADSRIVRVPTPYGDTSAPVVLTSLAGTSVALLVRGSARQVPAAMLPARANAWAFAKLGVKAVIVVTAAGGLRPEFAPGTYVVSDQLVDRTWGRPNTFYDEGRLVQLAEPDPFDARLRRSAVTALRGMGVPMRRAGTVVVIQGPRFNTRAESRLHASSGGDVVNMLLAPFVFLAQELGMGVCNISFVTDRDAGDEADRTETVSSALIGRRMADAAPVVRRVIWSMLLDLQGGFDPGSSVPPDAIAEVLARPVVETVPVAPAAASA